MTVYLDLVWLLNFFIDLFLLKLTALVLKRSVKLRFLLLGTFVASFIVLLLFTPFSPMFYNPLGKLLYSMLIIFCTFGFRRFRLFLQALITFYFVSFLMGGGLFALHFYLESSQSYAAFLNSRTISYGDPISWLLVILGFPALWLFSKKRFDHLAVRKWQSTEQALVTIRINGKDIQATGIIDSGNKLKDPLTNSPVMFISQEVADDVIPDLFFEKSGEPMAIFQDNAAYEGWETRLAMIPYRGVGGSQQFALAIKPDTVIIRHEGKVIKCKKVLIGLTQAPLSHEQDFQCILHPEMVLNGEIIQSAS